MLVHVANLGVVQVESLGGVGIRAALGRLRALAPEQPREGLRRGQGLVGIVVIQKQEARPLRRRVQPPQGPLGHGRGPATGVFRDALVIVGVEARVETEVTRQPGGRHDGTRGVARIAQDRRECRLVGGERARVVAIPDVAPGRAPHVKAAVGVVARTVTRRELAGKQGCVRGQGPCRCRQGPVVDEGTLRKGVEPRRGGAVVAVDPEVVCARGIQGYEEDVGAGARPFTTSAEEDEPEDHRRDAPTPGSAQASPAPLPDACAASAERVHR